MKQYTYTFDGNDKDAIKVCPLTGLPPAKFSYDCYDSDCSNVDLEKWDMIYGHRYHCPIERKEIEEWFEKQEKAKADYYRLSESLMVVRSIDLDDFYTMCKVLDKELISNRQEFNADFVVRPFCQKDEKFVVYVFEDDEVIKISICENLLAFIGSMFVSSRNKEKICSISNSSVPGCLAEAVRINLCLRHNMDVTWLLRNDNPVYIAESGLKKYVDAAYGFGWSDFEKLMARHLELSEIQCAGKTIYIKQEIDSIIRRET